MALQPAGNKGTLIPGQTIAVNKYTVQVERYLSQGGFAHVYLCRTAQPVFGTTHHVLKRIAVQSETMLAEVKKEVDIMRILRGHPNIVYLIDAAWHQMPNGMYEVFILMEFCQGGGIIDMMNRRLRERLTEAEILTIFVDVSEGVAAMHNLKPALLHRDLKVENILQASASSYKLCDFGSATPVMTRPPANNTEIRALEQDLNRHTTLQYRAPEMVDPYLRRPIDEKSDVWALGVLLYKLCYYTTPFEEHGPLAIINVQYRIPPYPVYSGQMNALIGSMLRELGAQRPSVFEILNMVHSLRGTKSRFTYAIPAPQPLSPTKQHRSSVLGPPSLSTPSNQLEDLVSFRSRSSNAVPTQSTPSAGTGIQARDKVLEAIAPMRRGRPDGANVTAFGTGLADRATSPTKKDSGLGVDDQYAWKQVKGHKSGVVRSDSWKALSPTSPGDDAWRIKGITSELKGSTDSPVRGGFGDAFTPTNFGVETSSRTGSSPIPIPPRPSTNPDPAGPRGSRLGSSAPRDAFHGLTGFTEKAPAPTLAEASKTRTGMPPANGQSSSETARMMSSATPTGRLGTGLPSSAYTQGLRPTSSSGLPGTPKLPSRPSSALNVPKDDGTPEQRFPSLEELDRTFASPPPATAAAYAGLRSQPVTGGAMLRDAHAGSTERRFEMNGSSSALQPPADSDVAHPQRPPLSRKHRSSVIIKQEVRHKTGDYLPQDMTPTPSHGISRAGPKDWLTGDDTGPGMTLPSRTTGGTPKPPGTPVLRGSPSKRASVIEKSDFKFQSPKEAVEENSRSAPSPSPAGRAASSRPQPLSTSGLQNTSLGLTENWSPVRVTASPAALNKRGSASSSDSSDGPADGPEDAKGYLPRSTGMRQVSQPRSKSRQGSVHNLVDLYGGAPKEEPKAARTTTTGNRPPSRSGAASARPPSRSGAASVARPPSRSAASLKPPPIAPKSAANSQMKPPSAPATRPEAQSRHAKQPSMTPPSAPNSSGRSRPQSMFIFPVSKSTTVPPSASPVVSPSPGLVPPASPQRPRSSVRRSSISDMVQMYESYAPKGAAAVVPPSPKPAPLKMGHRVSNTSTSTASTMPSPTVAAARFPQLSPTSSPTSARIPAERDSGLGVPRSTAVDANDGRTSPMRTSPADNNQVRVSPVKKTSSNGYAPSPKPYKAPLKPPSTSTTTSSSSSSDAARFTTRERRLSTPRVSTPSVIRERKASLAAPRPSLPVERKQSLPPAEHATPVGSPAPEKPYEGVGKLIDRWQKNIADAEPKGPIRGAGVKRTGVVAGRGS